MKSSSNDFEFAPGFLASDWRRLHLVPEMPDSDDWRRAIDMFRTRIERRFLDPVDVLIGVGKLQDRETFGFAILAIDFLVLETIQGFRVGLANHNGKSRELIRAFLTSWKEFKDCLPIDATTAKEAEKLADEVYYGYRCALHHAGATNGNMLVGVSGSTFSFLANNQVRINRTRFHEELKRTVADYLDELRKPDGVGLRRNFQIVMNAICS